MLGIIVVGYVFIDVLLVLPGLTTKQSDFGAFFYPAARAILEGKSPYLVSGLNYPPLFPLILAPLALLPYTGVRILWFALCHLFAAAAGYWAWQALGRDRCAALAVAGAWATSGALFVDLREGQINTLLLILVVLVIWPPRRMSWLGSAALAGSIALKIWPGVLLLPDAMRRRWRSVLGVCGLATTLVAIAWLSTGAIASGPTGPTRADFWLGSPGALNGSLPGLALRLLDRPKTGATVPTAWLAGHSVSNFRMSNLQTGVSLSVAIALFGAGTLVLTRATQPRHQVPTWPLVDAAFLALAIAAAPVVWPHYHVLQLPGVAMLAERFIRRRAWGRLLVLAAVSLASTWESAIIAGPYLAHFGLIVTYPALVWLLTSLMPAGAAIIWLLLIAELRRKASNSGPPTATSP